jgi:hypothetical protein
MPIKPERPAPIARQNSIAADGGDNKWPTTLSYWRRFAAEIFDDALKADVLDCVSRTSSTIPEWRKAILGDAGAAVALALRIKAPAVIGVKLDLAMTVLLRCAFDDAAAAVVMSHVLRKMPLDPHDGGRLATSWLVHNIWLGNRRPRAFARRSIASQLLGKGSS